MHKKVVSLVLALILLLALTGPILAEPYKDHGVAAEAGLGISSVILSVFYSPAKILYCALGTTVGGLAYAITIGNSEIAQSIIEPAARGTYIITPAILTGEEEWEFVGSTSSHRRATTHPRQ